MLSEQKVNVALQKVGGRQKPLLLRKAFRLVLEVSFDDEDCYARRDHEAECKIFGKNSFRPRHWALRSLPLSPNRRGARASQHDPLDNSPDDLRVFLVEKLGLEAKGQTLIC